MSDDITRELRGLQRDLEVARSLREIGDDIRQQVLSRTKAAIAAELYKAFQRLEAPPDLLSIIGSYGDTLKDEEVLSALKDWNDFGRVMQERQ